MKLIRTFIAIDLSNGLLAVIERLQQALEHEPGGRAVNWVRSEGIHLTIKFLGDTPEDRLPAVYSVVREIAAERAPFTLQVAGLGCFPSPRRPRVVWVGLGGELQSVLNLQRALENSLAAEGFEREPRDFTPHLTLGRVRASALSSEVEILGRTITSLQIGKLGIINAEHLSVIASTLTPGGAQYQQLYEAPLGARASLQPEN